MCSINQVVYEVKQLKFRPQKCLVALICFME